MKCVVVLKEDRQMVDQILEIFSCILLIVVIIILALLKKNWNSIDYYLNEKAKNYATKQDIEEITRKTETVHNEFNQRFAEFDADLQFKYKLYEKQYEELYSPLYCIVSKSEALKYVYKELNNEIDLTNTPILEIKEGNGESALEQIISLVNKNAKYASYDLIDLSSIIMALDEWNDNSNEKKELLTKVKISLVHVIINDYHWLRKQLKLPNNMSNITNGSVPSH